MTNRELLLKALPLTSLSRKEWNLLIEHIREIESKEPESLLLDTLNIIATNQARVEVTSNYNFYYGDILDKPVDEGNITGLQV